MNIHVGIVNAEEVNFTLSGKYSLGGITFSPGNHVAMVSDNFIKLDGILLEPPLNFAPIGKQNASFTLKDVTIGKEFHWERKEAQRFEGALQMRLCDGKILVVNTLNVERYLVSVISSEMSAANNLELLKAHAIVSRSWLLAQMESKRRHFNPDACHEFNTTDEHIKWYDKDDHRGFDVCADDHCQRYQGITRATTPAVEKAVSETANIVLRDTEGAICDARFSKCCGGKTEEFDSCWEDVHHDYLECVDDNDGKGGEDFCAKGDENTLKQVLNSYDQETHDFYRWKVRYSQSEIRQLIEKNSGLYFGDILDLIAIQRGKSGRIVKLKIVGDARALTIGKELEIRKWLSDSCLYSSAFDVEKELSTNENKVPTAFILHGKGWGHGVGMCQIGAAVMAQEGYNYKDILEHYFPHTTLSSIE